MAANGDLDESFGVGGKVVTSVGVNYSGARDIAVGSDGKIIAAGHCEAYGRTRFALSRFNSDGSLDSSFNSGGKVCSDLGTILHAITIDTDGKIIAAGVDNNDFYMIRYDSNGSVDTSFGSYSSGVHTDFGGTDEAYDLIVYGTKIYTVGTSDGNFSIARYNSDGSLDTSFDGDGKATTDLGSDDDTARGIVIDSSGKIIVVGYSSNTNGIYDFAMVRYNSDGTLDTSFGTGGKTITDIAGADDKATSVAIDGTGKIVVAGWSSNSANSTHEDFTILRYDSSGNLDNSFGSNGVVTTDIGGYQDEANSIVIDGNSIIVAGKSLNGSNGLDSFSVVKYDGMGALDTTFSGDGKLTTSFGATMSSQAYGVAVSGTHIVVAGQNSSQFALSQYLSNGTLDSSFDGDGKVLIDIGGSSDSISDLALKNSGKILAGGISSGNFALAQYAHNGDLDTSFGVNGIVIADFNSTNDFAHALLILPDNSIVLGGYSNTAASIDGDFALAHFEQNGTFDGLLLTDFYGKHDEILDLVMQKDGKVVAVGYCEKSLSDDDFALVRYTTDGALDTTFGTAGTGKVTTDFNTNKDDHINAAVLDKDDRIIVGGYSEDSSGNPTFAVACYTKDGQLDSSFSGDGKVETPFGDNSAVSSLTIDNHDKILAAGFVNTTNGSIIAVARYNSDGSADTTFDGDGKTTVSIGSNLSVYGTDVITSANGKIFISSGIENDDKDTFVLICLNSDGSPDTNFGDDAKTLINFGGEDGSAMAILLDTSGNIILGGLTQSTDAKNSFALSRVKNTEVIMAPIISYLLH